VSGTRGTRVGTARTARTARARPRTEVSWPAGVQVRVGWRASMAGRASTATGHAPAALVGPPVGRPGRAWSRVVPRGWPRAPARWLGPRRRRGRVVRRVRKRRGPAERRGRGRWEARRRQPRGRRPAAGWWRRGDLRSGVRVVWPRSPRSVASLHSTIGRTRSRLEGSARGGRSAPARGANDRGTSGPPAGAGGPKPGRAGHGVDRRGVRPGGRARHPSAPVRWGVGRRWARHRRPGVGPPVLSQRVRSAPVLVRASVARWIAPRCMTAHVRAAPGTRACVVGRGGDDPVGRGTEPPEGTVTAAKRS
jgi:hypothetical protein